MRYVRRNRTDFPFLKETNMIAFLSALLLITGLQATSCQQSFSYPVIVDVIRIEVVTDENLKVKEINDPSTIDSIVRFIDERRGRWCLPSSSVTATSATLNLYLVKGSKSKIGLGKGFLTAEVSRRNHLLRISPDEQQALFKLLDIDQDRLFDGKGSSIPPDC
jgi:hypothetical protein